VSRPALGLASLLFSGYWGVHPGNKTGRTLSLLLNLKLVLRLRIVGSTPSLPHMI